MSDALRLARERYAGGKISEADLTRAEYAVAEANFWLAEAQTR